MCSNKTLCLNCYKKALEYHEFLLNKACDLSIKKDIFEQRSLPRVCEEVAGGRGGEAEAVGRGADDFNAARGQGEPEKYQKSKFIHY